MYCQKCGFEVKETDIFCPDCGARILKKKKSNIAFLCISSLVLMYGPIIAYFLIKHLKPEYFKNTITGGVIAVCIPFLAIVAYVQIIHAKVDNKNNSIVNIIFTIYMIQLVAIIIGIIIFLISCAKGLQDCGSIGLIYGHW